MDGTKTPRAAWPQSGWAIKPAIIYEINTAESAKKTFSTFAKEPRSTRKETTKAPAGTVTKREIPNNSPATAIPANSAVSVPKLAMINALALKVPERAPYFWRTKPIRPWRVTTPMRAPKSWKITKAIVERTSTHSI